MAIAIDIDNPLLLYSIVMRLQTNHILLCLLLFLLELTFNTFSTLSSRHSRSTDYSFGLILTLRCDNIVDGVMCWTDTSTQHLYSAGYNVLSNSMGMSGTPYPAFVRGDVNFRNISSVHCVDIESPYTGYRHAMRYAYIIPQNDPHWDSSPCVGYLDILHNSSGCSIAPDRHCRLCLRIVTIYNRMRMLFNFDVSANLPDAFTDLCHRIANMMCSQDLSARTTIHCVNRRILRSLSRRLGRKPHYVFPVMGIINWPILRSRLLLLMGNHRKILSNENAVNFDQDVHSDLSDSMGGGVIAKPTARDLEPYLWKTSKLSTASSQTFKFVNYVPVAHALARQNSYRDLVICDIPLRYLVEKLTVNNIRLVARHHNELIGSRSPISEARAKMINHVCNNCPSRLSVYQPVNAPRRGRPTKSAEDLLVTIRDRKRKSRAVLDEEKKIAIRERDAIQHREKRMQDRTRFPPRVLRPSRTRRIIRNFVDDTKPEVFEEAGCAVCGQLVSKMDLIRTRDCAYSFKVLTRDGADVTRLERHSSEDPVAEIKGPVMDTACEHVCRTCDSWLSQEQCPPMALANDLWIGPVPKELEGLTYAEKMLVARMRHNRCIVKVVGGMHKMRANAITFAHPMPKIYHELPPPEELDEVLAFIYTGPCRPTQDDFKRTPMLVRRKKVSEALEWLKLNHIGYHATEISYGNLSKYPDEGPPVIVSYRHGDGEKDPEATAVNDNEVEDGTVEGPCPFAVHGLTGEELGTKSMKALIAIAMDHMAKNRKVLAIGHADEPESIYDNPHMYPSMFPWLFPYGLGGIGNPFHTGKLSAMSHKGHLLMYHDKRFQRDPHFPLIALNHEQIRQATTGGFLLTERKSFDRVAERLLNLNPEVIEDVAKRLYSGENVKAVTEDEVACYQVISDLDHIAHHVEGSVTNKKYMRNEIWSLISYKGAPSWFITFSPADTRHPIALYFADQNAVFSPDVKVPDDCIRLIASNPVASARFFNFMANNFIKHVLGVGASEPGIFGQTDAYYGTVEQQGRLTLHMHLLLWIEGALSPQEIRDRLMDPTSDFQRNMVAYLESVHQGEFINSTVEDVAAKALDSEDESEYTNPTYALPHPPPSLECHKSCGLCDNCKQIDNWQAQYVSSTNDLLWRSNMHECGRRCFANGRETCKSRFPRDIVPETMMDPGSGALIMKKGEAHMNTFSPPLTYMLRCNTDVTSLLSGTAIKAVVAYVTEYVTKPGLKTYSIFDTIKSVFDKNTDLIGGNLKRREKARRLMTQVVNGLTAKTEMGGPMAAMYLLKHPDHYTDHTFKPCYWKSFVTDVRQTAGMELSTEELESKDQVVVDKKEDEYVSYSAVDDYKYRPDAHRSMSLYDWVRRASKFKRVKKLARTDEEDQPHSLETDGIRKSKRSIKASRVMQDSLEYLQREDDACDDGQSWAEDDDDDHENNVNPNSVLLECHGQSATHGVRVTKEDRLVVPNFIGGSLPRADKGDREYYCCTMLTLFLPWRDGQDLKGAHATWDDAFTNANFSERDRNIMKNMNVRYECLDARDDYSEKMRSTGFHPDRGVLGHIRIDKLNQIYEQGGEFTCDANDANIDYEFMGNKGLSTNASMLEIDNVVRSAGWLMPPEDGLPEVDIIPVVPETFQSASRWDNVVASMRAKFIEEKMQNAPKECRTSGNRTKSDPFKNNVKIVNKSYLNKAFSYSDRRTKELIESASSKFTLNSEQERAFRTIANHAITGDADQLKMYVGGMAGTGKSQVFKALLEFFTERDESHRFMVLAPTGTAAALLNGSTYHSALGINDRYSNETGKRQLTQIRARLSGVEYVFIDEVSMISCRDIFRISAQMARATMNYDEPFGGLNVIFAGDFAQLSPVNGRSLYSSSVGTTFVEGMSIQKQEEAIGKALWHQVTNVVILQENMRQRSQTENDNKLRTALENMRYKACTSEDIEFLRTRIAGVHGNRPRLGNKRFRNVSVITAWNAHKDKINQLGVERFAMENGQPISTFYSNDSWHGEDNDKSLKRWTKKRMTNQIRSSNVIDRTLQKALWNLPHGSTEHIPGKLSICHGMPVMLRYNEATECCMTKGAEGTVAGWQASVNAIGKPVLDTLFVKLKNPPRDLKLDGLPANVVPITRRTVPVICELFNDDIITINRSQVHVLPNFAMTDYASQGRTRPDNVVDLNNCKSHQSYYTCLSRSASAEGTVIVQGFDADKIMGGAQGFLRQEFRELEILNVISRDRYHGNLPLDIDGLLRNDLIVQYRKFQGLDSISKTLHRAIRWSIGDELHEIKESENINWHIPNQSDRTTKASPNRPRRQTASKPDNFVVAKGSVSLKIDNPKPVVKPKRKSEKADQRTTKKIRLADHVVARTERIGLRWDSNDYSCGYDALFTVFYNVWLENRIEWARKLTSISPMMSLLNSKLHDVRGNPGLFEDARDEIRACLHAENPLKFPYGQEGINMQELAYEMMADCEDNAVTKMGCGNCDWMTGNTADFFPYVIERVSASRSPKVWLKQALKKKTRHRCPQCDGLVRCITVWNKPPDILCFAAGRAYSICDREIDVPVGGVVTKYTLKGIIYLGGYHFNARFVDFDGFIWFHDGIATGRQLIKENHIDLMYGQLLKDCRGKLPVLIIYCQA